MTDRPKRPVVLRRILAELERAYLEHGDGPWGRHEFHSIALEEFEEAWDAIKGDEPLEHVVHEIAQLAAVCIRYLEQERDRYGALIP